MPTSPPTVTVVAPSLAATHAIARALASVTRPGDVLVLAGEMGAGKTAFAQGFGRALGVAEVITSPTFTLVHSYDTPSGPLHHADIYRLEQLAEVADLALGELAGVVLVEWGDVVAAALGDHVEVRLEIIDDERPVVADDRETDDDDRRADQDADADVDVPTRRRIAITPRGSAWARRWPVITELIDGVAAGPDFSESRAW